MTSGVPHESMIQNSSILNIVNIHHTTALTHPGWNFTVQTVLITYTKPRHYTVGVKHLSNKGAHIYEYVYIHNLYLSIFHHKQCLYTHKNTEIGNGIMQMRSLRKLKHSPSQQCPVYVSLATCSRKAGWIKFLSMSVPFPLDCKFTISRTMFSLSLCSQHVELCLLTLKKT